MNTTYTYIVIKISFTFLRQQYQWLNSWDESMDDYVQGGAIRFHEPMSK